MSLFIPKYKYITEFIYVRISWSIYDNEHTQYWSHIHIIQGCSSWKIAINLMHYLIPVKKIQLNALLNTCKKITLAEEKKYHNLMLHLMMAKKYQQLNALLNVCKKNGLYYLMH